MQKSPYYLFFMLLIAACQPPADMPAGEYWVNKIDQPIQLSGQGDDPTWAQAIVLEDFQYPWRDEVPPTTQFRALWDGDHFYFLYRATDPEIITKVDSIIGEEMEAVESDRVEIFFKADDKMDPYYALELDALGRILDTRGQFYRKVDFDWDWPAGQLIVKASTDETGYFVEGSISLASLRQLGMLQADNSLKAGLYRGEYQSKAEGEREVKWISWIKPDSEKPDFHIPSSFGLLKLVD